MARARTEAAATASPEAPATAAANDRSSFDKVGRYREVDLLRFVAAVAVVAFHFLFRATAKAPELAPTGFTDPGNVFRYGYLGVDLFFVISGFVILRSAWNKSPSGFLTSRIGRLYPAFWVACTLSALVITFAPYDNSFVSPQRWLANLTMASETFGVKYIDGVYWTLAVELAFYLLLLLVTLVGLTTSRVFGFAVLWLAVSMVHQITPMRSPLPLLLVPDWAPYFIGGMAFALIGREGWRLRYVALLVAAFLSSLYRAVDFAESLADKYQTYFSMLVVAGVIVAIYGVFVAIVSGAKAPRLAGYAWLGGLTYPLYLLHENIGYELFGAAHALGLNRWIALAGVVAVIGVLAWLLHVTVENRCAVPLARWLQVRWATVVLAFTPSVSLMGPPAIESVPAGPSAWSVPVRLTVAGRLSRWAEDGTAHMQDVQPDRAEDHTQDRQRVLEHAGRQHHNLQYQSRRPSPAMAQHAGVHAGHYRQHHDRHDSGATEPAAEYPDRLDGEQQYHRLDHEYACAGAPHRADRIPQSGLPLIT